MERKDLNPEDFNWNKDPIIGLVLMNAERDSNGNTINPMNFYMVAKHKPTGKIIIELTDKTPMYEEFVNDILKNKKQFN